MLTAALAIAGCVTTPPVQEMSDARQAISAAEEADAGKLAPESLGDARRFLAEAEEQIQQEAYGPARMNAVPQIGPEQPPTFFEMIMLILSRKAPIELLSRLCQSCSTARKPVASETPKSASPL